MMRNLSGTLVEVYLVSKYLLSVCHVLVCTMSHLHSSSCQKQFRTPSLMVFTFNEKDKKNAKSFKHRHRKTSVKEQEQRLTMALNVKVRKMKQSSPSEVKRVVGFTAKGKIVLVDRHLDSHSFFIQ